MGINEFIKIGSRIKAFRKEAGLTQREMATKLDLTFSTYSNYENNYREPSADIIGKICDILEIDLPDLMGVGEPKPTISEFSNIEEKLYHVGYTLIGDEADEHLWINYPDGELSITKQELLSLNNNVNSFLLFQLEELKRKRPDDFKIRKK